MIRIATRRMREISGLEALLAEAFETVAQGLAHITAVQGYGVPGKDIVVEVILGGAPEAERYDVAPRAFGFFAVSSQERYDADDEDLERPWFDVAEGFEAHLNLEAIAAELDVRWHEMDEVERVCELQGAMVTLPHEVLHVLEWVRETGGLTPTEVYDAGMGEVSLARTLDAIDRGRRGGDSEDEVEALADAWISTLLPAYECDAWVARLDEAMAHRAPSP